MQESKLRFKDGRGLGFPGWKRTPLSSVLVERKDRNSDGSVSEVFSVAKDR